jgi:hypothetical protein
MSGYIKEVPFIPNLKMSLVNEKNIQRINNM